MGRFLTQVEHETGQVFDDYEDAWQWSVDNLEDFWARIWREFDIIAHEPYSAVLGPVVPGGPAMPGTQWFPGARLNFAEHIVRALRQQGEGIVLTVRSQTNGSAEWSGTRLLHEISGIQSGLKAQGIGVNDRVVGYLPNIPETVAAYIATASLGAIWCSVPPEMGPQSVLDRITQLDPSIIIAIDGYTWGSKKISRADELARIRAALPQLKSVLLPYADAACEVPFGVLSYEEFTAAGKGESGKDISGDDITFEAVAFEHPLVILFSSGTTGKPKAIVHCHGGILIEHFKVIGLQFDLSPGEKTFWFTTTGWMVWTLSISTLLVGGGLVLMDGDPNWPALDGEWSQWAILAETKATYMVTGSAYLAACAHAGLTPGTTWDLSNVREIQCSGSPLAADVAAWVYAAVNPDLMLAPTSGGTDICSGFLGGGPLTGVYAGEMSCRPLGVAVDSWDESGHAVTGVAGELVCTKPMPSMPVFFWGDTNNERYLASYFDTYPGIWRHGDWLVRTPRDTWVITGRSDATLNRGGVRLGTAEFYAILDPLPGITDSMVLHFEDGGGMGKLVLLVAASGAQGGAPVSAEDRAVLEKSIRTIIRTELSPRHVPDFVAFVPSIPRTSTGKRLEIPLKRIIAGAVSGTVIDVGALAHPEHLDTIVEHVRAVLKGS
ncbi:acetoacetate--CoA ligase [Alpinimonas psychrophila]